MDKKHGLFSKSHSHRSRSKSPVRGVSPIIIRRRKGRYVSRTDRHISEMLPTVIEGPDPDGEDSGSSVDYSRFERRCIKNTPMVRHCFLLTLSYELKSEFLLNLRIEFVSSLYTPWLGPHAAKGPVRPLRRALQGLDPRTTANIFASARCIGEKKMDGEDCFILKLCADPATLRARSEGASETIRHTLFGYFSQKTGLLVHLEDSQLTRIQNIGGEAVYWETTINSYLEDYKPVEGIVIAHSGRSVATLLRFGDVSSGYNTKTTMQEAWVIDEIAFNVPGLSMDCFIPPSELRFDSHVEDLSQGPKIKTLQQGSDR
ncbi:hypothetical protein F2Q70_00030664 [Brassica cretica]|uniref:Uncharacterized protein n=1 Tax=Brassica cretica TaxID=69181 RepID=A0A8S9FHB5_BRACR|nr:hypothetical protein F2Q70_00030664 [Brassica cretica]